MQVINAWTEEDSEGFKTYITVEFEDKTKVDVVTKEDGFSYVMETGNGGEVYVGADEGIRDLSEEETDMVLCFVSNYLANQF